MLIDDVEYTSAEEVLGPKGPLSKQKGFISRKGQIELAKAIEDDLNRGNILIAEAGTGTGKTFAYLIPALLNQQTTVISTASKALQDQLINKDLPKIFNLLHLEHSYMSLKGFNNYLCLNKFHNILDIFEKTKGHTFDANLDVLDDSDLDSVKKAKEQFDKTNVLSPKIIEKVKAIEFKYLNSITKEPGLYESAEITSRFPKEVADALTIDRMQCLGSKCDHFVKCCAFMARKKATSAKVVVINHALFFSALAFEEMFDPLAKGVLLPKFRQIIFDEAHDLNSVGCEHLSSKVGVSEIKLIENLFEEYFKNKKIKNSLSENLKYQKSIENEISNIKNSFSKMYHHLLKSDDNDANSANARNFLSYKYIDFEDPLAVDEEPSYSKIDNVFLECARDMYRTLHTLYKYIENIKESDPEFFDQIYKNIGDLISTLVQCMLIDDKSLENYGNNVASITVSKKKFNFEFKLTPLDVNMFFGNFLKKCQENHIGVVLTSATLSVDHKFNKIKFDLGVPSGDVHLLEIPSHFKYETHAALYLDETFPDPNQENREEIIWKKLRPVIDATPGGIFILTTSISSLHKLCKIIKEDQSFKRKLLCQYETLSNTKMLDDFKKDGHALLIGSVSFWAGVDVPGNALSLVIIDKLPFASPQDPIFKARCRRYEHKRAENKNRSFMDISIPESVIALRQGVGRLIRHENDYGALIICDPRIIKRHYGQIFKRSLPPMKRLQSSKDLLSFLHDIGDKTA